MKMKLHAELIFIWKVSHLDSFWNRGIRELGNGLFECKYRQDAEFKHYLEIQQKLDVSRHYHLY